MGREGLKHKTIKSYLSAVRHLHIAEGVPDPFQLPRHRLEYILKGVKRCEAEKGPEGRDRLPISPDILRKIKTSWESVPPTPDAIMLWAACCLAFFGFLRAGELTVPSDTAYDPKVHLNVSDIAADNPASPTVIRVSIKQSKTDPFRRGVHLFIGKTGTDLCPVNAMLRYLVVRGTQGGPLFRFQDGRLLTRPRFVEEVWKALQQAGIDQSKYCGHSFRIGAATTAAARGMEDSVIKTLGRWRSLAYLDYVRIPRDRLAQYSNLLAS